MGENGKPGRIREPVSLTIMPENLHYLDECVDRGKYRNRSHAVDECIKKAREMDGDEAAKAN